MVSALVEMDFVHTSRNVPRLQPGFFKGSGTFCSFRWGERPREPARQQPRPTKKYHCLFRGVNPEQPKGEREFPFAWFWRRLVNAGNLRRFQTAATVQYR
jgi:hypothetical protein